jgi:hypothetical protein
MKHYGAPLIAVLALAMLTPPALAADATSQRVKKLERRVKTLERRVNALAQLHLLTNDIRAQTYDATMLPQGSSGYVQGSVSCPAGSAATGGGVLWSGQFAASNYVYFSGPYGFSGWQAGANGGGASVLPRVQVVCASLE